MMLWIRKGGQSNIFSKFVDNSLVQVKGLLNKVSTFFDGCDCADGSFVEIWSFYRIFNCSRVQELEDYNVNVYVGIVK